MGGEQTQNLEFGTDIKFTRAEKGSFESSFLISLRCNFDGNPNSTLGYELAKRITGWKQPDLESNLPEKICGEYSNDSLRYDGRKSQDVPMIHIGNLVARYLFLAKV